MGPRRDDVSVRAGLQGGLRGGLLPGLFAAALLIALPALTVAAPARGAKHSATPNRYGAIAFHRASQSWGVSYNHARARDASVEALRLCGHRQCEVVHKFKNGCAALADGPQKQAANSGATRDEAETKALRYCRQANQNADCTLIAWACTR